MRDIHSGSYSNNLCFFMVSWNKVDNCGFAQCTQPASLLNCDIRTASKYVELSPTQTGCKHIQTNLVIFMQLFCIYIYIIILFNCSAGGVELLAKQGRIKVVNTLESRLEMMSKQVCNYILY